MQKHILKYTFILVFKKRGNKILSEKRNRRTITFAAAALIATILVKKFRVAFITFDEFVANNPLLITLVYVGSISCFMTATPQAW